MVLGLGCPYAHHLELLGFVEEQIQMSLMALQVIS